MAIATVNPATGETVQTFDPLSPADLEDKLARAAAAAATYRLTSVDDRIGWLRAAADVLDRETDDVARLMTLEMGKTLSAAKAEATKCARALRYYAEHGPAFLLPQPADAEAVGAKQAYVIYQPIGVVLAIMPWNFPLWQAMRFAAPALMAGQSVAAIAGDALKKTVLELGGSDPFLVMPSADLDRAAEVAVTSRCQNNGQSCISAKRFIVHAAVADRFEELFAAKLAALVVGDPMDEKTDVGPLSTSDGRDDVEELVADAVGKGARVVVGGSRVDGPGWFYPPTLITGITPEMRMYREEVFGPVAALYRVPDLDAGITLANDVDFGLGANIWTNDEADRERFIRDAQAGMVFVNGMVTSYPQLPFGGVKDSGYGRELTDLGMHEFMNAKTVWIN